MKLLIFILLFTTGCSSFSNKTEDYVKRTWNIIENASTKKWSTSQLINHIGQPTQVFKQPAKHIYLGWIYDNKSSGFQEWGISIEKNNIIDSVTYLPKDPYRHEFTIEKIMARWKNLNCSHKTQQKLSPGLVKTIAYLDCDNGHRIVKYNMYKEVESILVDY